MNGLRDIVAMVNGKVNDFVWGLPMLVLLVGTGILMTVLTKGFQLSHFRFWMAHTVGAIFKNKHVTAHTAKEDRSISQFQSLCTALAATIGTGNIAGVAAAIALVAGQVQHQMQVGINFLHHSSPNLFLRNSYPYYSESGSL